MSSSANIQEPLQSLPKTEIYAMPRAPKLRPMASPELPIPRFRLDSAVAFWQPADGDRVPAFSAVLQLLAASLLFSDHER